VKLAVLTETGPTERRVAMVPDVAKRLVTAGWEVSVQAGAGTGAWFSDDAYRQAGAAVAVDAAATLDGASVLAKVQPLTAGEARLVPAGTIVLSFLQPATAQEALRVLAERRATVLSFDLVPRISRAQGMDALSSQATVSGYRAALCAAEHLDKFFPMFMTAAGTVPPAKVLVMGAGVAGLQAIATARRLGAVVRAYDVRAAAREEAESVGATFVDLGVSAEGAGGYARELSPEELRRQQEALAAEVAASDVVITTAAVPGRPAPILVTAQMVDGMAAGSVVIDMAADSGQVVERSGTRVVGMANPPSGMPTHASLLYSRNVANLLALMVEDGALAPDWGDEILQGTCVLHEGRVAHRPTAELLGLELVPLPPATGSATAPAEGAVTGGGQSEGTQR
jgi:NAD(P) transhydrogenase subunit alpha